MVILSSLRRSVMAHLSHFSMFCFGGLAPFNALLISFLSRLASPHLSCLQVTSVAAMMALYRIRFGTVAKLRLRESTSCLFCERGLLLRFVMAFVGSICGGLCFELNCSNLRFYGAPFVPKLNQKFACEITYYLVNGIDDLVILAYDLVNRVYDLL